MSLADAMAEEMGRGASRCKYAQVLDALRQEGDPEVDRFAELVQMKAISGAAASRILSRNGHPITGETITKHHRPGECCCRPNPDVVDSDTGD